jgi:hypothetical protein
VGGDIFDQLADIDAPAVADANSALKVLLFALDTLALVIPVTSGSVDLVIEGTDKLADEIRGHQLMSESFDNPSPNFASTHARPIDASSLPSSSGARDVVFADRSGRPPADAADRFSG